MAARRPGCLSVLDSLFGGEGSLAFKLSMVDELPRGSEGLTEGERTVRTDLVAFKTGDLNAVYWRSGYMTLTNYRILVTPTRPNDGSIARRVKESSGFARPAMPPARFQLPYERIHRVWRWQPEFSSPVFIQTTDSLGVTYRLIRDGRFSSPALPVEAQREHVEVLERMIAESAKQGSEDLF